MKIIVDLETGCGHIRIKDEKGNLLFVTDRTALLTPIYRRDHAVLIGLKQLILNTNTATGVNFAVIKTAVESREF